MGQTELVDKYLEQQVFNQAKAEGLSVTFGQVKALKENPNARLSSNISQGTVKLICNLFNGWRYILMTLNTPLTEPMLEDIHFILAEKLMPSAMDSTVLRVNKDISPDGTDFVPKGWDNYLSELTELERIITIVVREPTINNILKFYLTLCKRQYFIDVNKRTAILVTNKLLLEQHLGFLLMPDDSNMEEYLHMLNDYYKNEVPESKAIDYLKTLVLTTDN